MLREGEGALYYIIYLPTIFQPCGYNHKDQNNMKEGLSQAQIGELIDDRSSKYILNI